MPGGTVTVMVPDAVKQPELVVTAEALRLVEASFVILTVSVPELQQLFYLGV